MYVKWPSLDWYPVLKLSQDVESLIMYWDIYEIKGRLRCAREIMKL